MEQIQDKKNKKLVIDCALYRPENIPYDRGDTKFENANL